MAVGARRTAFDAFPWPAKVRRSWPVCKSQSLSGAVDTSPKGHGARQGNIATELTPCLVAFEDCERADRSPGPRA